MQAKDFASGPGEVGGAGVLVPVTVTNKSSQDLPLASVLSPTVNYGEGAGTPASEIVSASDAVPATLAAGQTGPDGGHTRRTEPLSFSLVPMQVRDYR